MYTLVALALAAFAPPGDLTLDEVLALHQQYLDRFQSVEAEIEAWVSRDNGTTWVLNGRDQWWRVGSDERGTRWTAGHVDEKTGKKSGDLFQDESYSNGRVLYLQDWDPHKKRNELPSPANQYYGARGVLTNSSTESATSIGGPVMLLLRGAMVDYLASAVASAQRSRVFRVESDGRTLWCVELSSKVPFSYHLRYTMDPEKGFAPVEQRLGIGENQPYNQGGRVVEYRLEPGDTWVPARVIQQFPNAKNYLVEYRLTRLKLNQPVDPAQLHVDIPEGMLVMERDTPVSHIWGKDGPKLTFPTREALKAYEMGFYRKQPRSWHTHAVVITLACLVIGFFLLRWRRRLLAVEGP